MAEVLRASAVRGNRANAAVLAGGGIPYEWAAPERCFGGINRHLLWQQLL